MAPGVVIAPSETSQIISGIAVVNLDDVYSQLGEIISKNKKGRENPEEVTVFDSTGLGVQDLAISNYVYEKYCKVNKIN